MLARRVLRVVFHPWVFVPATMTVYLTCSFFLLRTAVETPRGRTGMLSGDTGHYLGIAEDFARGDWSMDYVKGKPHRQPLYPALIASVIFLAKGENLFWLAVVNVAIATLGFVVLYVAILRLYENRWVPAVVGILYLINPFLLVQTTRHLLTEPLHVFLMIGIIYSYLAYQKTNRFAFAAAAAALTGLDYLNRPNGLFIFVSLMGVLVLGDLHELWTTGVPKGLRKWLERVLRCLALAAIFIVITTPSWWPRLHDFGNPVYHGYLSNYMWVDTYQEGHVGQVKIKYTWHDYVRTHTLGDAVQRMAWGVWRIPFEIPWTIENTFPLLILLATLGVLVALIRGPTEYRLLFIFATVQLLPLMWTTISNPTVRVPYGSTVPFELAFAAYALQYGGSLLSRLPAEINRRRQLRIAAAE